MISHSGFFSPLSSLVPYWFLLLISFVISVLVLNVQSSSLFYFPKWSYPVSCIFIPFYINYSIVVSQKLTSEFQILDIISPLPRSTFMSCSYPFGLCLSVHGDQLPKVYICISLLKDFLWILCPYTQSARSTRKLTHLVGISQSMTDEGWYINMPAPLHLE
jgi:hypothetical protein